MAAVGGVEQLAQAVVARGRVGRDERGRRAVSLALDDREARGARGRDVGGRDPLDRGERRRLAGEPLEERVDRRRLALGLQQHAALVVEHPAREPQLAGEAVHERPEPDALHRPLHARADPPPRACHRPQRTIAHYRRSTSSRSTWYALACASWMRGMCWDRVTITWSASPSAATRPPS